MRIDTYLQPNCSESSWRITGPMPDLKKIHELFLEKCDGDNHTEFINGTLLLQTTDQDRAADLLPTVESRPGIAVYEDLDRARDCTCGGGHCPEKKWTDLTNSEMLAKGLIKQVKTR